MDRRAHEFTQIRILQIRQSSAQMRSLRCELRAVGGQEQIPEASLFGFLHQIYDERGMSPLPAIFPAALMRLFEEELLVRVDAVVHETRELVFYLLELVVGDRLRDGCETAPMACRVGQPRVRQPRGGEQESHALCLCGGRWRCFLRLRTLANGCKGACVACF